MADATKQAPFTLVVCGYSAETLEIELIATNESKTQRITKSYGEFEALTQSFEDETSPVLPTFPSAPTAAAMTRLCSQLNSYLASM